MTPGPERPVFVGGTGRSGTTIAGRLIDQFPGIRVTRPREVRFISGGGGVLDAYQTALQGQAQNGRQVSPAEVVRNLRTRWFKRTKPSGFVSGLHLSISRTGFREAMERYQDEWAADPRVSSRHLVETIINGEVGEALPLRWADTTPMNARRADALMDLFPDARVLHMTRDGRDVAVSFAHKSFGPKDIDSALQAWFVRMNEALEAESRAPAGAVCRLPLSALAVEDRERSLQGLAHFLDLSLTPEVSAWFDAEVSSEKSNEGRWRRDASAETASFIDTRYAGMLETLTDRWGDPFASGPQAEPAS